MENDDLLNNKNSVSSKGVYDLWNLSAPSVNMFLRLCKRKLLKTKHHTNPGAYIYTLKLFVDGSKRMRKWLGLSHIACCDPCISVAESRPLWAVTRATTSRNRMRRSLPTCHCLLLRAQTTFRSPPSGPLGFTSFVIRVLVTKPESCVIEWLHTSNQCG